MRRLGMLFAVALALFSMTVSAHSATETITIGLQAPMTGDMAEYGKNFERAVFMARDEINARGGVLGKQLAVKVADSKGEPKEAASIANQFTNDNSIVAVIGDFNSGSSLAALPIYERNGCVLMSPTSSNPKLVLSKWFFRTINSDKTEAAFFAAWASKDFGKRAAIFFDNNDWGLAQATAFTDSFQKNGGTIVGKEAFGGDVKDFRTLITKMKGINPDIVYMATMYTPAALIMQQSKELKFAPKFVASVSLHDEALLRVGGDAVNGLYLGTEFFPDDPRPAVQAFIKNFKERYKLVPGMYPALAYDTAYIVTNAIKTAGKADRAAIRDTIESKTKGFDGVTGVVTVGADHEAQKALFKLVIQDGKFTMVK